MFYYCDYNSYFFNKFLKKERYVDVWKRVTLTMLHLSPARLWSPDGLWHRCFHLFTRHKVLYILFFITSIVRICYVYIKLAWVEWLRAASVIAWGRRASKYKLSETRIHLTDDAAIWSFWSYGSPLFLPFCNLVSVAIHNRNKEPVAAGERRRAPPSSSSSLDGEVVRS